MNAMVGNAGELSNGGYNENNPHYVQFFRLTDIPLPSEIFVFVEEHPDSINDGYFLNKFYTRHWIDLPASEHDGALPLRLPTGTRDCNAGGMLPPNSRSAGFARISRDTERRRSHRLELGDAAHQFQALSRLGRAGLQALLEISSVKSCQQIDLIVRRPCDRAHRADLGKDRRGRGWRFGQILPVNDEQK